MGFSIPTITLGSDKLGDLVTIDPNNSGAQEQHEGSTSSGIASRIAKALFSWLGLYVRLNVPILGPTPNFPLSPPE